MCDTRTPSVAGLATLFAVLFAIGSADAVAESPAGEVDYAAMSTAELADYLIFGARGFKLDQQTQEGTTVRERLTQDELQKACSDLQGARPDAATVARVTAIARDSIVYPQGGIALGDWKNGETLARSGFGFRVGHKTDDHSEKGPGGNCYACHQLDPEEIAYGTLGPSLKGYGKTRGTSEATLKYTYEMIYNGHAYFPCTNMPRFGANKFLTQEQIADVMAYVMHPESPVNK